MANDSRTYRHKVTGLVGVFPTNLGNADPNLREVKPDAKPLAYTPIPRAAVEALEQALSTAEPDERPAPTKAVRSRKGKH